MCELANLALGKPSLANHMLKKKVHIIFKEFSCMMNKSTKLLLYDTVQKKMLSHDK